MQIRPELQALRVDDTPQRQAQAALREIYEHWRSCGPGRLAEDEVARFGGGAALDDLPLLAALFAAEPDSADTFTADLFALLLNQLAVQPLSQVPLRYSTNDTLASLLLARHGTATLVVQAIDGAGLARKPVPLSATFSPTESYERVLAGNANAVRVRALTTSVAGAELSCEDIVLAPGMVRQRFGTSEAQMLRQVPSQLVTLKLQRRTSTAAVSCEYRLSDGALIHQAAGNPRDSRLELSAALLGRMGRSDAAPLLAAMAEENGSSALRWQVLRECLGLDSAAGFAALSRIAQNADDPLAGPAGVLRAQLLETHPQLAGVRPCPA